jgi:hypothetical protein
MRQMRLHQEFEAEEDREGDRDRNEKALLFHQPTGSQIECRVSPGGVPPLP